MSNSGENIKRIIDKESLQAQLSFVALFIGIYEHMKKTVLFRVEDYLCSENHRGNNGKIIYVHNDTYKNEIEQKTVAGEVSKDRLRNTMLWLNSNGAITKREYELFRELREKRNTYTHDMTQLMWDGISEDDVKKLISLLDLYSKIEKWWINEIEIPTTCGFDDYEKDSVESVAIMTFKMMVSVLYCEKGEEYQEMLNRICNQD